MDWTTPFIIGPLCAGAGILLGMLIMRGLNRDKSSAKALETLREEFDDYRTNVNEHFAKTSSLFEDMTEKYRDVYNHLSAGAQQFGGSEETARRLEIVQPAAQLAAAATALPEIAPEKPQETQAEQADETVAVETQGTTPPAFDAANLDEAELADLTEPLPTPDEELATPAELAANRENHFRDMPETVGQEADGQPVAEEEQKEAATAA